MKMRKIFLSILLSVFSLSTFSQVVVRARIDSSLMLIGEQTRVSIEATFDKKQPVEFPLFSDTIVSGVEVLAISRDTVEIDNKWQVTQHFYVTSFDSGLYLLPPFKVILRDDTFSSESLALKVLSFPVDTTELEVIDQTLKPVLSPRFVIQDYLWPILIGLLVLLLLAAGIYAYIRIKNNKPILGMGKPQIILPAHVRAIQELEKIKEERLPQDSNRCKEFYTRLTDILRVYFEERFGVDAMEMTSSEILEAVKHLPELKPLLSQLKEMLLMADLAKFAKYDPSTEENIQHLSSAYRIISETKKEEIQPASSKEEPPMMSDISKTEEK